MTLILVPQKVDDIPSGKARRCERCHRHATWENDVVVQVKPTFGPTGPLLKERCLCRECREKLDG